MSIAHWTLNTNHQPCRPAQRVYAQEGLEVEILPIRHGLNCARPPVQWTCLYDCAWLYRRKAGQAPITALGRCKMRLEAGLTAKRYDLATCDLEGKTYAGFGSAWEDALISTMIENDGGIADYDTVTLGTGA
ncbi:ABC transporter substrate-binding protein [Celeribacter halophilus]|uniref:ABC transporter substrate-binding protein n=1 Tax=Celeribacter halophilus TaxID=576117 RepID=UPI003A8E4ED1